MTDLKKLLDEATPGPWEVGVGSHGAPVFVYCNDALGSALFGIQNVITYEGVQRWPANAALIVAAVNAVPELLALREEVVRLREALGAYNACADDCIHKAMFSSKQDVVNHIAAAQNRARAALNQEGGQ